MLFRRQNVRGVVNAVTGVSERRVCRVLKVPRSLMHPARRMRTGRRQPTEGPLVNRLGELAVEFPTFGYRRLWAILRRRDGILVNRKVVYRILKANGWFVHQRSYTPRPRVQGRRSRAACSNERWAMGLAHISCGRDGWAHLASGPFREFWESVQGLSQISSWRTSGPVLSS